MYTAVYVPVRPSKYCCLDTSSQNAIGHHVWLSTVFSFAVWLLLSHRIYLLLVLQIITIKRAACLDHFKYLSLMRIRDVWKVVLACTRKAAVESLLKSRTQTPVVQSVPGLPGLPIYDTIWHNAYHDIFLGSVQILSEGPWWTWPGSVPCRPHCRALPRRRRGSRKAWTTRRTLSGRRCCSWNLGRVTLEPSTKKKVVENITIPFVSIPWKLSHHFDSYTFLSPQFGMQPCLDVQDIPTPTLPPSWSDDPRRQPTSAPRNSLPGGSCAARWNQ